MVQAHSRGQKAHALSAFSEVYFLAHPEDIAHALRAHLPLDVLALQEVGSPEHLDHLAAALDMRVAAVLEASETVGLTKPRNPSHLDTVRGGGTVYQDGEQPKALYNTLRLRIIDNHRANVRAQVAAPSAIAIAIASAATPTPATHSMWTVLKAGETVYQIVSGGRIT